MNYLDALIGSAGDEVNALVGVKLFPTARERQEQEFQSWYKGVAEQHGLNPDPDAPEHFYDYRAAHAVGAIPDDSGHWPSQFKKPGHPQQYVNGIDTITGKPVETAPTESVESLLQSSQKATEKALKDRGTFGTAGGILEAAGRGALEGLTTEIPQMFGQSLKFVGIQGAGEYWANWAEKKANEWYGPEEERGGKGLENVVYQATKMLAPSLIPAGIATTGARLLTGVGKLVRAAKIAEAAGEVAKAADIMKQAQRAASMANKIGSAAAAGFFGLSQAQQTADSAIATADELDRQGKTKEAEAMRKEAHGIAPWVTGTIEAAGEYLGTKYLGKLLGLSEAEIGKRSAKQIAMDFLRTLGVETGTEFGQQYGEAGVEKLKGIRPKAEPLAEALDVVLPTAFMTLITGGFGAAGGAVGKSFKSNITQKDIDEAMRVSRETPAPTEKAVQDFMAKKGAQEARVTVPAEEEIPPYEEGSTAKILKPEAAATAESNLPTPTPEEIAKEAEKANTEPTEAQKEAGNYKKGHINIQGLDISIENPRGSIRSGVDAQGKEWKSKLSAHYGYIRGTEGTDTDQVDVFIGPKPEASRVFVIDQVDPGTREFDEHKALVGYASKKMAENAYLRNYPKGWQGLGATTEMTVPQFKEWLRSGDTTKPLSLKESRKIGSGTEKGKEGNILIKAKGPVIYESSKPVHALMLTEFGINKEDIVNVGRIGPNGAEEWTGEKTIAPLTEETARQVRAIGEKRRKEALAERAAAAPSFRHWVTYTGGINPNDKTWKGELDDIRWDVSGGKKVQAKGFPVGFWNEKSRGMDERTQEAIEAGWLPKGATEDDFLEALSNNQTMKAQQAGETEDLEGLIQAERQRMEEEYQSELEAYKDTLRKEWESEGRKFTEQELEDGARFELSYDYAAERDQIKAASLEELEDIWDQVDQTLPEGVDLQTLIDEAADEISAEDQVWLDEQAGRRKSLIEKKIISSSKFEGKEKGPEPAAKWEVGKNATKGKTGNLLVRTKDGTVYESSEPIHALVVDEFNLNHDDVDDLGMMTANGPLWRQYGTDRIKTQLEKTEEIKKQAKQQREEETKPKGDYEALYNEAQDIMRKLPSNIGKAKQEGKLSGNQLKMLDRLDEIEKIMPSTGAEWKKIEQAHREKHEKEKEERKAKGKEEGAKKLLDAGLQEGDKVQRTVRDMLTGAGLITVEGTVKLDIYGDPYVQSSFQKGKLDLDGWTKVEAERAGKGEAAGGGTAPEGPVKGPVEEKKLPQPQPPKEKKKPSKTLAAILQGGREGVLPDQEAEKKAAPEKAEPQKTVNQGEAETRLKNEGVEVYQGAKYEIFPNTPTDAKPFKFKAVLSRPTPYLSVDGYGVSPIESLNAAVVEFKRLDKAKTPEAKPEEKVQPEPSGEAEEPKQGNAKLVEKLVPLIAKGNREPLTWRELFRLADEAYGGTQAEGKYTPKDAYDAMEVAVNKWILEELLTINPTFDSIKDAKAQVEALRTLLDRLPTQTKRTAEMDEFQQFSTPWPFAYAVAWVANIQKADVVVEPSAGTGNIATMAKLAEPKEVIVNELSNRRLDLLKELDFDREFNEDASQLNNILPLDVKPTVIVMNPPFSATAGRIQGKRDTMEGARHIEQALKRLQPDGRLVAIVGRGMAADAPTFKSWWDRIKAEYNVLANIRVNGKEYTKFGTHFDNQIIVIDKTGKTTYDVLTGEVDKVEDLIPLLTAVRNDRAHPREQVETEPGGKARPEGGRGEARPQPSLFPPTGEVGPGKGQPRDEAVGTARKPGGIPLLRSEEGHELPRGEREPSGAATEEKPERPAKPGAGRPESVGQPLDGAPSGIPEAEGLTRQLQIDAQEKQAKGELTEDLYEGYRPERVTVQGAKPHPTPLVQSAAMAAVSPPVTSYNPSIPQAIISSGKLSDIQIESIIYAGHAHEQTLPGGAWFDSEGKYLSETKTEAPGAVYKQYRRGYFIGDGTGVGKGREIAGILMDNWNKGRKKHVWITEKKPLFVDAKRDVQGVGWNPKLLFEHYKTNARGTMKQSYGVLFTTYDTLKGKPKDAREKSRLDQVVEWLGPDFDGVIAFDESHNMGNAVQIRGERGWKPVAQKALAGVELQRRVPNARVIYVSATGATEVINLAYADRLGVWGEGTPFSNKQDFVTEVSSGGMAAMEMVARDLKQFGLYTARSLSYDDGTETGRVEYDRLEHSLTPEQVTLYNKMAEAWQVVLRNINAAMELTGVTGRNEDGDLVTRDGRAKGAALSQFWGGHQRFFNQVLTAMQTPTMIKSAREDLKNGNAVVVQLVNTMEAAQERALAKLDDEDSLEDLDLTPRDALMQMVQTAFPVRQYEQFMDEQGNILSRPVTDSKGNFVENPEAVAMRDRLLDELGSIKVPDSPLDMIIEEFGEKNVAEVTGRRRRVVRKETPNKGIQRVIEQRSRAKATADADAFMDGKKNILIFSEAGGTGRSYHADMVAKNQKKRVHYLLQAGWRADKAVQGLGRTHRSNQKQAPKYYLVTTNLKGQKRFLSSIARRLDQLGALTKGQRQTGSQGIFNARDNLENQYARDALVRFFTDLAAGRVPSITIAEFMEQTGLKLIDERSGSLTADLPSIQQFLNRLLSLNTETMDSVFDEFSLRMDRIIEAHVRAGTLDQGLETLKADKVEKVGDQVVHTDTRTGSETRYVQLDVTNPAPILDYVSAKAYAKDGFWINKKSGKVWAATKRTVTNAKTGGVRDMYVLRSATYSENRIELDDFTPDKWDRVPEAQVKAEWKKAVDEAPKTVTRREHMVTGALLPVWDRLVGHPRIMRVQTTTGERMIGRLIEPADLPTTLRNLGAEGSKLEAKPGDIFHKVLDEGYSVDLANGWQILRKKVSGEDRIELKNADYRDFEILHKYGVFSERIQYTTRYFIPTSKTEGVAALESILKNYPAVAVNPPAEARLGLKPGENIFGEGLDRIEEPGLPYGHVPITTKSQLSIFDFKAPAEPSEEDRYLPASQRVRVSTTGNLRWSGTVVQDSSDVASLLASIRKSPQELFYSVAADKQGRIIEIHKYAKGTRASAVISPTEVVGRILNLEGVSRAYLVHNHPSGEVKPSPEDVRLSKDLSALLSTKDIQPRHIILGRSSYKSINLEGLYPEEGEVYKIPPAVRKVALPIKERASLKVLSRERTSLTSAAEAMRVHEEVGRGQEGVLFMDRQNRPLIFVPVPVGKPMKEMSAELIATAESVNAGGAILYTNATTPERYAYFQGIAKGGLGDIWVLDVIGKDEKGPYSWSEAGKMPGKGATYEQQPVIAGETLLRVSGLPNGVSGNDLYASKKLLEKFTSFLKIAGVSKGVMERIDLETRPFIGIEDNRFQNALSEWSSSGMIPQEVLAAVTLGNMRATIELSMNVRSLGQLERTAYHEWYHIAKRWLLPEEHVRAIESFFPGEEGYAGEAEAFADFASKRRLEGVTVENRSRLHLLWFRFLRLLEKINHWLEGNKPDIQPEEIFARIMSGSYRPQLAEPGGGTHLRIEPTKAWSGTAEEWNKHVIDTFKSKWKPGKSEDVEAFKREQKHIEEEFTPDSLKAIKPLIDLFKADKRGWRQGKPDTTLMQRLFSIPSHYFERVPTLKRMFDAALSRVDMYWEYLNSLTKGADGKYLAEKLDAFRKSNPEEYKKFGRYLVLRDRNHIGYKVETLDDGTFQVLDPRGRAIGKPHQDEDAAWSFAIQHEADMFRKSGYSETAVDALISSRLSTHVGFQILNKNLKAIIASYEKYGWDLPVTGVHIEGNRIEVNFKEAMAIMGDIRGYYFPRIRRPGRFMLTATKKGENPFMEFFDTRFFMARRQRQLEKQGFTVEKGLASRMPEDVFQMAGRAVAMQAQINEALSRIASEKFSLDDFGLKWTDRIVKPGLRDFVLTGPTPIEMTPVFKSLGGKFYSAYEGETRMWHFYNPGKNFDQRLAKALALQKAGRMIDRETQSMFAQAFTEELANIIKGRGHRAHMIARQLAKGKDVWLGYEEDPAMALTKYARGLAAGEAKRIMAMDMVRAFTGTDISWRDFRADNPEATYEDYMDLVNERRIDPVLQPHAFKDAKVYMEDLLRNEEWVDRFTGIVKGIAVLKYLGGRVSAPLVNLTSLVTSVPAAMEGFANIPIHRSFKLIGDASRLYGQYKFGDRSKMPKHLVSLFDEIEDKGWHTAQYNREALAVLQSKFGRGWDRLIHWGMYGFGVTEQLNRVSTIAGTYMGIKLQTPAGKFNHDAALALAKEVSDKSHGVYGKANYPFVSRGGNPAAQVVRAFYVFRTFSHNYLATMKKLWGHGWTPEHAKAFTFMALSPAVLAGAGASVLSPVLATLLKAVGIGGDDPEEAFYAWLKANVGVYGERFGRFGAFGLAGVSLKGSLAIAITDIPTTIPEILGAPGSIITDLYQGVQNIARGDILKGSEKMLPLSMAAVSKTYREATEGITTRNNAPVFYGNEPLVPDVVDSIYRAASFNPARIAGIREEQWKEKELEAKYRDLRTDLYARLKKFYLLPVEQRYQADYLDILARINDYNQRIKDRGLEHLVPPITAKSVRNNLKRSFRPSKVERYREIEGGNEND